MKTASQKKAKEALRGLPRFYAIPIKENRPWAVRCYIGEELYVNVGSFSGYYVLNRLRKLAKENGWNPSDLFPAYVSSKNYNATTHIVRVGALESIGRDKLKNAIYSETELDYYSIFGDDAINAAHDWKDLGNNTAAWRTGKNKAITDEQCAEAIAMYKEHQRLVHLKEEPMDIETCIRVLKEAGYKIMKPITEYQEI